jgi:hypothetical protein
MWVRKTALRLCGRLCGVQAADPEVEPGEDHLGARTGGWAAALAVGCY